MCCSLNRQLHVLLSSIRFLQFSIAYFQCNWQFLLPAGFLKRYRDRSADSSRSEGCQVSDVQMAERLREANLLCQLTDMKQRLLVTEQQASYWSTRIIMIIILSLQLDYRVIAKTADNSPSNFFDRMMKNAGCTIKKKFQVSGWTSALNGQNTVMRS